MIDVEWLGAPEGHAAAIAISVALGILLLVFGRRLFWLAVAALGFGIGFSAARFVVGDATGVSWVAGVVVGAAGALLAVLVQRVAVIVAGGVLGAAGAAALLQRHATFGTGVELAVVLGAALLGAALALGVFALALRLVTSAVGAGLVTEALALSREWSLALFAVLWVTGFLAQGGGGGREAGKRTQ